MEGKIILAEDNPVFLDAFARNFRNYGFEVNENLDGDGIIFALRRFGPKYFDAIVSDTEMIDFDGPVAIRSSLEQGLLDLDRTVVIGMSDDESNQKKWYDLANHGCFYNKCRITSQVVAQCISNFQKGDSPIFRARMPRPYWLK